MNIIVCKRSNSRFIVMYPLGTSKARGIGTSKARGLGTSKARGLGTIKISTNTI